MVVHTPSPSTAVGTNGDTPRRSLFRGIEWLLGILGGLAVFLGAFILLAGDEQSIGLGGQVSWQVDEIDPAWGYSLLAVGALALLATVVLVLRTRATHRGGSAP
jgi:hypothetical protein